MFPDVIHVSLLERLRTFNYFSKPLSLSNEQERKQQIVATRVFILLLLVSFIILISYYGAERVTTTYETKSPTFEHFINLQNDQYYNPSFSCPCSTITISYEAFIQLNYTLHPFCSSDFVQQQWLNYSMDPSVVYYYYDFRALTPVLFNSLASFCEVSAEYINNELISFNASSFITDKAVSPETFVVKTNAIADTFISSTSRSFAANLALIRNTTQTNAIMSTYMTNFIIELTGTYPTYSLTYYDTVYIIPSGNTSVGCACGSFEGCTVPISIYFLNSSASYFVRLLNIPGLFVDCLIIDGIRKSSFICLFNQSCVDLMSFWLNISTANAIDSHDLIHFYVNSTIDDIINETFVDQWTISASHRAFYQQCNPNYCSYSLNQHNSVWIILTVVLSLIGGLTKILQAFVPSLVQGVFTLYDRCSHRIHRTTDSASVPVNFSFRFIVDRIHKFNLFSSNSPTTADNEHEIRGQIISTRLFLVFVLISLIILTIYSSQVQVTKTVTITNPSMEQYLSLYDNHSLTLTCPCKNIDIPQQTFLNLQPTFHQVCASDFVDPRWSDGIYNSASYINLYYRDFRSFGVGVFNTIASFCQLSLSTINDRLLDFGGSSFVTAEIIPQDLLLKQGQALIDLFISTNKNTFVSSLQTIRDTTQVNTLISGFETSMSIKAKAFDETNIQLITSSRVYNTSSVSCSCYFDPTCTALTGLYFFSNKTITYIIPGFYISCYVVESTLKSNLLSLYNQSWIDDFRAKINFDYYNPVYVRSTALNSSLNSTYNITTPINDIMQNMMTEYWYTNVNYSAYYEQCDPIECKYTYAIKYDIVYIVTTIIGLIGGLVTIFQLIIPRVVKIIRKCWLNRLRYPNVRVIPMIQVAQNE